MGFAWHAIVFLFLTVTTSLGEPGQTKARIVGGEDATAGAYPWMAALVKKDRAPSQFQCGGVLIAPQWVLTAAHCVDGENRNTLDVWINLHDLGNPAGAVRMKIAAIVRHRRFRVDRHDNLHYDAALILLKHPVPGIPPIDLAGEAGHNQTGEAVRVLGWGTTHPALAGSPLFLQQADLFIADLAAAQPDYQGVLGPSHLAAGVPDGSRDACFGDSGGPLFRTAGGRNVLVGISSFGDGCGTPGIEGIYTNVLHLRPWIDRLVNLTAEPPDLRAGSRRHPIRDGVRSPSQRNGTLFDSRRLTRRDSAVSFRLRNRGAGMLQIFRTQISGSRFRLATPPPRFLLPKETATMEIRDRSGRSRGGRGMIRIRSNDPAHPWFRFRIRGKRE